MYENNPERKTELDSFLKDPPPFKAFGVEDILAKLRGYADDDAPSEPHDRRITIPQDSPDRLEAIKMACLAITNGAEQGIYSLKNLRSYTIEFA